MKEIPNFFMQIFKDWNFENCDLFVICLIVICFLSFVFFFKFYYLFRSASISSRYCTSSLICLVIATLPERANCKTPYG